MQRTGHSSRTMANLEVAGPALAQDLAGTYQTQLNDDGNFAHVRFAPCGQAWCGTMVRSFNRQGQPIESPHTGRALVWDMVPAGGGAYKSGKIWDPGADKTYRSKMQLEGNMLKVSGCIGPICKSQSWKKVN